ncbi:MAG: hypothetical protein LUQ59_05620, partial [Methanothrix sp.]|nr:hypothetical protein [Methanothrix sp.]
RVFVVGTLTEKDDIGGDTEYWRGRVVDPTGSILIYAGQYQPEAAQLLASMDAPSFVAVVGKTNLYRTDDGNIIISLRAESIQKVDEATRNQWIMDTARRTLERLVELKNVKPIALSSEFATADNVPAAPTSTTTTPTQDAERAVQHYHTDIDHFRQMILRALTSLKSDLSKRISEPEVKPTEKNPARSEDKSAAERVSGEPPAPRKSKQKKSESLSAWPEAGSDDEVETINIGKKS